MALGDSYATLIELKTRLVITDVIDDNRLTEALAAASRGIEKTCRRQFNRATVATARTFYPDGHLQAEVDDFHTVTGLVIETDDGGDGAFETLWVAEDYQLEPLNGVVDGELGWPFYSIRAVRSRRFPLRIMRAPLRVTAQWGWSAVPAPVKEAALVLAEDVFKLRDTPFGAGGFGEFGRIRARENPHVAMLVYPYRRDAILVA